jgi:uncharacterized protein
MKYLLVTALVLVVFWLWRHNRQAERKAAPSDGASRPDRAAQKSAQITEVVACSVCQVHLPRAEAVAGRKGLYCSEAHRRQAGD